MNTIKASIIIPTYNRLYMLKKCLKSLQKQTISKSEYEIIVIDDGSSDGTSDFLVQQNTNIKMHQNLINMTRNVSRNNGIKKAKGEILIFLDDDVTVEQDFIKEHLKCYDNNNCLATVGRVKSGVYKSVYNRYNDTRGPVKYRNNFDLPWKHFVTNNCSAKRDVILNLGLFDENIVNYGGDDVEMGFRISELNGQIVFCENAIAYHFGNISLIERCLNLYKYGNTSFKYILNKHPGMAYGFKLKYFKKYYYRILFKQFFFKLFCMVYRYVPDFVSYKMISYILAYCIFAGWKNYDLSRIEKVFKK